MASRVSDAATSLEFAARVPFEPGSIVIERYSYQRESGTRGTQWIIHRVRKDGGLDNLIVCETRREAAQWVIDHA